MKSSPRADGLRSMREARLSAKSSGGGVEGHASGRLGQEPPKARPPDPRPHDPLALGRGTQEAGIKPGPSEAKRGRPRIGEVRTKPWLAEKMSRSTWYRRKAEARKP